MLRQLEDLRNQAAADVLQCLEDRANDVSDELKPLLALVQARLFEPDFDANVLYRASPLSEAQTAARFTEELGATPGVYITHHRLEVGGILLANTDLFVFQIASVLGYNLGRSTFSDAFHRWSGLTPTGYRARERTRAANPEESEAIPKAEDVDPVAAPRIVRSDLERSDDEIRSLASRLAVAVEDRAARRRWDGDDEGSRSDLVFARECYDRAGELPPEVQHRRRFLDTSATPEPVADRFMPYIDSACLCGAADPWLCRSQLEVGFAGPCPCDCHPPAGDPPDK